MPGTTHKSNWVEKCPNCGARVTRRTDPSVAPSCQSCARYVVKTRERLNKCLMLVWFFFRSEFRFDARRYLDQFTKGEAFPASLISYDKFSCNKFSRDNGGREQWKRQYASANLARNSTKPKIQAVRVTAGLHSVFTSALLVHEIGHCLLWAENISPAPVREEAFCDALAESFLHWSVRHGDEETLRAAQGILLRFTWGRDNLKFPLPLEAMVQEVGFVNTMRKLNNQRFCFRRLLRQKCRKC